MSNVATVYRKEMRAYLVSPIPYILVALFTLALGYFFFEGIEDMRLLSFWLLSAASMENLFSCIPVGFAVLVPAVTMRLWSEEYRAGTLESLRTLPVTASALVLGKFFSAWTLLAVCLVATLPITITVASLGDLDMGPVWGGYLGALFLGAALLALGLWLSSVTRHQIVAFLLTLFAGLLLCKVFSVVAAKTPGGLGDALEAVALDSRYASLGRGVLELRDLVYFATLTTFFLYLNAEVVANRRYR